MRPLAIYNEVFVCSCHARICLPFTKGVDNSVLQVRLHIEPQMPPETIESIYPAMLTTWWKYVCSINSSFSALNYKYKQVNACDLLLNAIDQVPYEEAGLKRVGVSLDGEHGQLIFFAVKPCCASLSISIYHAITCLYDAENGVDDSKPVGSIPKFLLLIHLVPMLRRWKLLSEGVHERSDAKMICRFKHSPPKNCSNYHCNCMLTQSWFWDRLINIQLNSIHINSNDL